MRAEFELCPSLKATKKGGMKGFLAPIAIASFAIVVASACGASSDGLPTPQSSDAQVQAGFELAKKQACFGCHQVQGKGGGSGPAFDKVDTPKDASYLRESITNPDAEITQGYRKGVMSSALSSKHFSDDQLNQLVAYLQFVHR